MNEEKVTVTARNLSKIQYVGRTDGALWRLIPSQSNQCSYVPTYLPDVPIFLLQKSYLYAAGSKCTEKSGET